MHNERSQPGRVSSLDPWALCFWVLWQHSDVAAPWYWGPWARRRGSNGTSCQTGLMLSHFKSVDCQVAEAFLESSENLFWFVFRCLGGRSKVDRVARQGLQVNGCSACYGQWFCKLVAIQEYSISIEKQQGTSNTSIKFHPSAAQGTYQIGFLASGSWPSPCVDIVDSLWRVQEKDPLASENARDSNMRSSF